MNPTRRTLLAAAALLPAACGFELRRAPELRFSSVALTGFAPKSLLGAELRDSIAASRTTEVVETPAKAQVVLESLADAREKSVVASTARPISSVAARPSRLGTLPNKSAASASASSCPRSPGARINTRSSAA